jgi:hypothetical protein
VKPKLGRYFTKKCQSGLDAPFLGIGGERYLGQSSTLFPVRNDIFGRYVGLAVFFRAGSTRADGRLSVLVRPGQVQQTVVVDGPVGSGMMVVEPAPVDVVVGSPMLATMTRGGMIGGGTGPMVGMVEGAMRAGMQSRTGRKRRAVRMDNLLRLRNE